MLPPTLLPAALRQPYINAAERESDDNLDSPEHQLIYNTHQEIAATIEKDLGALGIASLPPARRRWWIINELNTALMFDGAVIGVMYNNPELINAGLSFLPPLKLNATFALLTAAKAAIPTRFNPHDRTEEYLDWVENHIPPETAEELERLCEHAEPYAQGSLDLCKRIVLEDLSAFFKS